MGSNGEAVIVPQTAKIVSLTIEFTITYKFRIGIIENAVKLKDLLLSLHFHIN